MNKSAILVSLGILTSSLLVVPNLANAKDLNWVGCGISKKAFMGAMAKSYEEKTGVKIILQGGGATRGIRDVAAGKADIGGSCRHLVPARSERAAKLNHVAWDAVVVIVNPSNPVSDLNKTQLENIFSGKTTNWKNVGGPDLPISVVVRQGKISGVGMMVRELLFQSPNYKFASSSTVLRSSGPVEKMVEKDAGTIAFTGVSSARKREVKLLSVGGKKPTAENISNGSYAFARPLYLGAQKNPLADGAAFLTYALSPEGQAIISNEGTVTLKAGKNLWPLYRKAMKSARVAAANY